MKYQYIVYQESTALRSEQVSAYHDQDEQEIVALTSSESIDISQRYRGTRTTKLSGRRLGFFLAGTL